MAGRVRQQEQAAAHQVRRRAEPLQRRRLDQVDGQVAYDGSGRCGVRGPWRDRVYPDTELAKLMRELLG